MYTLPKSLPTDSLPQKPTICCTCKLYKVFNIIFAEIGESILHSIRFIVDIGWNSLAVKCNSLFLLEVSYKSLNLLANLVFSHNFGNY